MYENSMGKIKLQIIFKNLGNGKKKEYTNLYKLLVGLEIAVKVIFTVKKLQKIFFSD